MKPRRLALLFFLTSLLAGLVYWWQADWWAYVDFGGEQGRVPKFKLHPIEQAIVSAVVGSVVGSVLTAAVYAGSHVWSVWRRRN